MYFTDYVLQRDMKYVPNDFSLKDIDGLLHHASVRAKLHTVIPHKHRSFDTAYLDVFIFQNKNKHVSRTGTFPEPFSSIQDPFLLHDKR